MNTVCEEGSFCLFSPRVEAVICECSGLRRTVNDIVWSECLHKLDLESSLTSGESPPLAHI